MIQYLSYPMTEKVPTYGDKAVRLKIDKVKDLKKSDSCNTYKIEFENHWGTHVDCPAHFFEKGVGVADVQAKKWRFSSPQVITVRLKAGELLDEQKLKDKISSETDLLLLKSGWYKKRGSSEYSLRNPGIKASVGLYLRKMYPRLRAIGFDWVSLSSRSHREEGRMAHKAFLNPKGEGRPIFLIEDMDLSRSKKAYSEIWVSPLRIQGIDSAPCTVFGVHK